MKFGYFDDEAREYVITTPYTPYPWINYLGTQDFFSLVSNTAGGYCFYRDARLRRILRYRYNDIPVDSNGRYFYINDGGTVWSPTFKPVKTPLEFYECRHGLGYTRITGRKNGLEASVLFFVPQNDPCELHCVTLRNLGAAPKEFTLTSFLEFCLWDAAADASNFQRNFSTGEVDIDGPLLCHTTEYRERRNHFAFYAVNRPVDGFDTDRDAFLGPMNGLASPAAVMGGKPGNSRADGWHPIASHFLRLRLEPGESTELIFVLGYAENPPEQKFDAEGRVNRSPARALLARYDTNEKCDAAFSALRENWEELLSRFRLHSGDERLDRMADIWNPYQCMVTFNLSRSASYFESGTGRGMGFRDSNQDILGFVHMLPAQARARIRDLAATQLRDGGAYHQYQPLTKRGNNEIGGNFNDDPLWLICAVAAYVKETGDAAFLDEPVPFENDEREKAPLLEHCRRSFWHVLHNLGPHGLPLIGRADWNDCLNLNCFSQNPDEPFQTTGNSDGRVAESVLIAAMFVLIGQDFAGLCRLHGLPEEAAEARRHVEMMRRAVLEYGWDGEWFLRAYDSLGHKVGSHENDEGKIYIETQGFCVMAGIGLETGQAAQAMDSLQRLLETPYGVLLCQPAYTKYHPELGEISSYPPGYKENAAVFCHNNAWAIAAEAVLGRGDRAFSLYRKIAPAYLENISEIHRTEPYVYSQMVAGRDASRYGEAKNSWLTGTAAWNFFVLSQYILGVRTEFGGLRVDPCIPAGWEGYRVRRVFRGAVYEIEVKNPGHVCRGVASCTVDGKPCAGALLPLFSGGTHRVEVVLGKA